MASQRVSKSPIIALLGIGDRVSKSLLQMASGRFLGNPRIFFSNKEKVCVVLD